MAQNDPEPAIEEIDYLLERRKTGRFLYENFKSWREAGIFEYREIKPVRPTLGDLEHLTFLNIFTHSFLYMSPSFVTWNYKLGKLLGYFSAEEALAALRLKSLVSLLRKSGFFWMLLKDKRVQDAMKKGWMEAGGAILEFDHIDKEKKRIICTMKETAASAIEGIEHPICYFEVGILSGQIEYLCGDLWDGIEKRCVARGDPFCLVEIYQHKEGISPEMPPLTREEFDSILNQYISIALSTEKDMGRKELKNFSNISLSQSINYIILSRSRGHRIFVRFSGRNVGERIAKKVGLTDLSASLEYLRKLFFELKVGIMEPEFNLEKITIKMKESVYSSGVNNIHMKLCAFISGIIEGCLNEATKTTWLVEETKCIANGDSYCEFECKTQEPEILKRLLLG